MLTKKGGTFQCRKIAKEKEQNLLIKGAIRRSDNSIRFIIGETDIKITEENLDSLLLQKPIYKSLVKDEKRELLFDVIKVGGTQHGN